MSLPNPGETTRTEINRLKQRSVSDRAAMYEILDSTILCHIGYVEDGQPFVLPYAFTRDGDRILIHGSSGARFMRQLAKGAPTCITVTKLDGLVLARTTFDSSMNYRSVVVLGTAEEVTGENKNELLEKVSDGLVPGRTREVRKSTAKELAATTLLSISLAEASVKIRTGMPQDDEGAGTGVWSGVIPIHLVADEPIPSDEESRNLPIPKSVIAFTKNPKG
jgi:nitroimidazol reductase NimA-like FMN-containing flavoprotein (pyridoxamine 5'-phosphate oxidase superfamily)